MNTIDPSKYRDHRFQNRLQTVLLILALLALLGTIGWLFLGWVGFIGALVLSIGMFLFGQRISPAVVLRMYRARRITEAEAPDLVHMHIELSRRAKLDPIPGIFYIPSRNPNAFAVGVEGNAAVAVTDGLLRMMNGREVAGIIAHELAHIQHGDTRVMAIADSVSRLIGALSQLALFFCVIGFPLFMCGGLSNWKLILGCFLLLIGPLASNLIQLALSRSREFDADLGSAILTGDPRGLASALQKLERRRPHSILDIFFPGKRSPEPAMLRTHPPTPVRVEKLLALENQVEEIQFLEPVVHADQNKHTPPSIFRVRKKPRIHRSGVWY